MSHGLYRDVYLAIRTRTCATVSEAEDATVAVIARLMGETQRLRSDKEELTELYDRMCVKYDRLRKALENVARTAGQSDTRGDYIAAVSLIGDLEQMADKALQGKDPSPAPDADPEVMDPDLLREDAHERQRLEKEHPWKE